MLCTITHEKTGVVLHLCWDGRYASSCVGVMVALMTATLPVASGCGVLAWLKARGPASDKPAMLARNRPVFGRPALKIVGKTSDSASRFPRTCPTLRYRRQFEKLMVVPTVGRLNASDGKSILDLQWVEFYPDKSAGKDGAMFRWECIRRHHGNRNHVIDVSSDRPMAFRSRLEFYLCI